MRETLNGACVTRERLRSSRRKVSCHYPIVNYYLFRAASAPRESIKSIVKPGSIWPKIGFENSVDPHTTDALLELASDIGGKPMLISSEAKVLYHAAACMASNYFIALMDAALTLCDTADIDRTTAWEALNPLVGATLENVTKLGPPAALTGPIARGDVQTVRRHLDALGQCDGNLQDFYRIAGKWALQLAAVRDDRNQSNQNRANDDAIAKLLDPPSQQEQ